MSDQQLNENYVVVQGLEPGHVYQFRVVAVDGEYEMASLTQDVHTYATLPHAADRGGVVIASSGWFIGMLLALLVLFGVCVVVCLVKRNRGGKYAVQEQEHAHGRNDYDDAGGFMEYTQQEGLGGGEKRKPSISSEMRMPAESDTESIADYADGNDAGIQFYMILQTIVFYACPELK
jgi:neuronal cell adhesion protein